MADAICAITFFVIFHSRLLVEISLIHFKKCKDLEKTRRTAPISVIAELLQEIGHAILKLSYPLLQIDPALIVLQPISLMGADGRRRQRV